MKGRHLPRRNAPSFDFSVFSLHFDTTFSALRGLYSLVPLRTAGKTENRPIMLPTRFIALLQDAAPPPTSGAQSMVKIVAGVLALVLVVIIILRRKSKGKKDEEEEF
jgi:hypothetical protein